MCVIILKKPGIKLPYDKIESACEVNKDGFGVSVLQDNKTLMTYRQYNPKGNDPKELADIIDKHIDCQQYIHLRYSTKGDENLENTHPFTLLNDEQNGYEVQFMHNGTLSYHGLTLPKGYSDTRAFAEGDGQRYTKLLYQLFGTNLLNEPDYTDLMARFLEDKWYFLTYDNLGNYKIQGKDAGHWMDDESWWASNTYSFNRTHRQPQYSSGYSGGWVSDRWQFPTGKETGKNTSVPFLPPTTQTGSTSGSPATTPTGTGKPTTAATTKEHEAKVIGYAFAEAKRKKLSWASHTPPKERPTFTELAGLSDISDVFVLTEEDIHDMCTELPEATTLLIMDLILELSEYKKKELKEAA